MHTTTDGKKIRTFGMAPIGGNTVLTATTTGLRDRKLKSGACVATPKVAQDKVYSLKQVLNWPGVILTHVAFILAAGYNSLTETSVMAYTGLKNTAFGWLNFFGFQAEERITPAAFFSRILNAVGLDTAYYLPMIQAKFTALYPEISWATPVRLSSFVRSICTIPGNVERQLSLGTFLQCLLGSYNIGINFMMLDESFGLQTGPGKVNATSAIVDNSIWAGYTPEQIDGFHCVIVGEPFKVVQDGIVTTDAVLAIYNPRLDKYVVVGVVTNLSLDHFDVTYVDPKADSTGFIGTILNTVLAAPDFASGIIGLDAKLLTAKLGYELNLTVRVRMVEAIAKVQGNTKAEAKLQAIQSKIGSGELEQAVADLDELAYAGITEVVTPSTMGVLHTGLAAAAIESAQWLANQPIPIEASYASAIGGVSRQPVQVS